MQAFLKEKANKQREDPKPGAWEWKNVIHVNVNQPLAWGCQVMRHEEERQDNQRNKKEENEMWERPEGEKKIYTYIYS